MQFRAFYLQTLTVPGEKTWQKFLISVIPGHSILNTITLTSYHTLISPRTITPTQPPREGKAFWQAEVQKMIKVYKAPIGDNDAAVIVNYLAATY